MRFDFDSNKSSLLRNNPKRGIGFEEAQEIFSHPYYEDCRSDDPEQFRAIGWVNGNCTRSCTKFEKTWEASTIAW